MNYEYWTWWIGGLALAALTILFRFATSRALGVSGSWYRVAFWRQEQQKEKAAAALTQNEDAAANALMAAALAEFGEDAVDDAFSESANNQEQNSNKVVKAKVAPTPWTAHLVFLVCTFLGALIWSMYTGTFQIQFELSELHTQLSGPGWKILFSLFIGGCFVGIGTQMAGGCSSGHGLSGCSNFSRTSLVATLFFFGTAVLVSMSFQAFLS